MDSAFVYTFYVMFLKIVSCVDIWETCGSLGITAPNKLTKTLRYQNIANGAHTTTRSYKQLKILACLRSAF